MTDTWAAKVLDGVPRHNAQDAKNMTGYTPAVWLHEDAVVDAVAKLGAGDRLVERAWKYPEILMGYGQGDMDGVMALISRQALHESADLIFDLIAYIVALTLERDENAQDAYMMGQWKRDKEAAEAEAAALRAKLALLEGQIKDWEARIDDCEWSANSSLTEGIRAEMRAALTDGGKDE